VPFCILRPQKEIPWIEEVTAPKVSPYLPTANITIILPFCILSKSPEYLSIAKFVTASIHVNRMARQLEGKVYLLEGCVDGWIHWSSCQGLSICALNSV
jgi:hypothetical protein